MLPQRDIEKVVVLAHAFVTGGAESESERDIRVGGIGDVPASVFAASPTPRSGICTARSR